MPPPPQAAVLILVLVDVGLGQNVIFFRRMIIRMVLILVLVDVGLGRLHAPLQRNLPRLNPCFSGCWSRTEKYASLEFTAVGCLNPCFSGCWSRTHAAEYGLSAFDRVLILVLVDVGLGHSKWLPKLFEVRVLILVLVDVGLGQVCPADLESMLEVLILVLVDVGLGPREEFFEYLFGHES